MAARTTLGRVGKLSVVVGVIVVGAVLVPPPEEAQACGGLFDPCPALQGARCTRNSECPASTVCFTAQGYCAPQCREDRDCGCSALPGVSGLFSCLKDQYGNGSCVLKTPTAAPAACVNAFDCGSKVCASGHCR